MKTFRLSTLLLVVTVFAVSLGWFIDHNSRPQELYLHLYSCRYDFLSSQTNAEPDGWQCYATIAFTPGEKIYFHSPMFYSPTVTAEGRIDLIDNRTTNTQLKITAFDAGLACVWDHDAIENIGDPVTCIDPHAGMYEFMIMVSPIEAPPDMGDFSNPNL
ncbi:hypothetical protein N9X53_04785 [Mariniblastus sp.]|nr:hypothetical protein [Mariniblastus sp.]